MCVKVCLAFANFAFPTLDPGCSRVQVSKQFDNTCKYSAIATFALPTMQTPDCFCMEEGQNPMSLGTMTGASAPRSNPKMLLTYRLACSRLSWRLSSSPQLSHVRASVGFILAALANNSDALCIKHKLQATVTASSQKGHHRKSQKYCTLIAIISTVQQTSPKQKAIMNWVSFG